MNEIALDTNILVYLYDSSDLEKRIKSELLLSDRPLVSAQVVSEFINVTKRQLRLPKFEILEKCRKTLQYCEIIPINNEVLENALRLIRRYDFQLFDSIIVASALAAHCNILYSEDLQHNQRIDNRLTIVNPLNVGSVKSELIRF